MLHISILIISLNCILEVLLNRRRTVLKTKNGCIIVITMVLLVGCATDGPKKSMPHFNSMEWTIMECENTKQAFTDCLKQTEECRENLCASRVPDACRASFVEYRKAQDVAKKRYRQKYPNTQVKLPPTCLDAE